MLNYLLPFIYAITVLFLLIKAGQVMSKGFFADQGKKQDFKRSTKSFTDRTGQVTVHPEILNEDGSFTDEELLTVRFSSDSFPSKLKENSEE